MKFFSTNYNVGIAILFLLLNTSTSELENGDPQQNQNIAEEKLSQPTPLKDSKIQLKLCSSSNSKVTQTSIQIPTFSNYPEEFQYTLKTHNLNSGETFLDCPTGEKLGSNVTRSISIIGYENLLKDDLTPYYVVRAETLLLENGYLSVGLDGNFLTYYAPDEFCIHDINGQDEDLTVDFKTCSIADDRPILRKCCPLGMILGPGSCIGYPDTDTEEPWYPEFLNAKSLEPMPFSSIKPTFTSNRMGCSNHILEWDGCHFQFHPVTDNSAAFISASRTWKQLKPNIKFCFERRRQDENSTDVKNLMILCNEDDSTRGAVKTGISYMYMVSMYVGAFFHFLTTFVYLITWPKQNIHGRTLCSCTLFLFFMQLFMGTAHLLGLIGIQVNSTVCVATAIGGHYFTIGAFTWLVVVNIDLWWTFRSVCNDKARDLKRFLGYSALGWGFPLLITVISAILNFAYKCRTSWVPIPEYGQRICFVAPWAQGYFVYYILGVLIAISFTFSGITLASLCNFKKDINRSKSTKWAADKQTVVLFVKLSVVMGLTWVFEVISWAATKEGETNHWIWIIFDLYNFLSAILIFIIFVCNRSTLILLEQIFPSLKGLTTAFSKCPSAVTGETSLDHTEVSENIDPGKANQKPYDTVKYVKNGGVE